MHYFTFLYAFLFTVFPMSSFIEFFCGQPANIQPPTETPRLTPSFTPTTFIQQGILPITMTF